MKTEQRGLGAWRAVAAAALILSGAAAAAQNATSLHQEVNLDASPQRVFEALLDSKQFAAFTGRTAEIDRRAGGAFQLFGGVITGRNIELVANRRIVQAWRDDGWGPGVYSLVKFELRPQGSGTQLVLDHTGFAPADHDHLNSGWPQNYWDPLKKYLASGAPPPKR